MFSRRTDPDLPTETVKGPSLARGPAWIVGLVLSVFGLMMFFEAPGTPLSTAGFPDGGATGEMFLGFEVNAWTAWFTTAAGVFVLIGAAQHLAARTFSLIAGVALGFAAIVALIDGDVLGLAAANGLDIIGWAIASGVLLVTALLPRVTRERPVAVTDTQTGTEHDRLAERGRARIANRDRGTADDPAVDSATEPAAEHEHHRIADTDATSDAAPSEAPTSVTYGDRDRAEAAEPAGPGGVRSAPLRRTYDGQPIPETEADREAQAAAADDQPRAR